jgi:hypothetical protein
VRTAAIREAAMSNAFFCRESSGMLNRVGEEVANGQSRISQQRTTQCVITASMSVIAWYQQRRRETRY